MNMNTPRPGGGPGQQEKHKRRMEKWSGCLADGIKGLWRVNYLAYRYRYNHFEPFTVRFRWLLQTCNPVGFYLMWRLSPIWPKANDNTFAIQSISPTECSHPDAHGGHTMWWMWPTPTWLCRVNGKSIINRWFCHNIDVDQSTSDRYLTYHPAGCRKAKHD